MKDCWRVGSACSRRGLYSDVRVNGVMVKCGEDRGRRCWVMKNSENALRSATETGYRDTEGWDWVVEVVRRGRSELRGESCNR